EGAGHARIGAGRLARCRGRGGRPALCRQRVQAAHAERAAGSLAIGGGEPSAGRYRRAPPLELHGRRPGGASSPPACRVRRRPRGHRARRPWTRPSAVGKRIPVGVERRADTGWLGAGRSLTIGNFTELTPASHSSNVVSIQSNWTDWEGSPLDTPRKARSVRAIAIKTMALATAAAPSDLLRAATSPPVQPPKPQWVPTKGRDTYAPDALLVEALVDQ